MNTRSASPTTNEGLARRVIGGAAWLMILRGVSQVISFVRILVLARLLAPVDFGLVGLVAFALMWVEAFSQPALDAALVRTGDDTDDYLDTTWTLQVARAAIVAAIIAVVALPVSWFFSEPSLAPMLWAMAGATFLGGLGNVAIVYFRKNLEFDKQFKYEISGILADLTVSIVLAFLLRNAWALIGGMIAWQLARLVAGYVILPYRPRLSIRRDQFIHLYGFGKWMLTENLVEFLMNEVDILTVGRWFGPASLGIYQMSYRVANLSRTPIADIAMNIAYPAFARLQDDRAQLRHAFWDTLRLLSLIAFPLATGTALVAPEFVRLVLGPGWEDAIPMLQLLTIYGLLHGIEVKKPLVLALGRPDIDAKIDACRLVALVLILIPACLTWGIVGVGFAMIGSIVVGLSISLTVCARLLDFSLGRYVVLFRAPGCGAVVLLIVGLAVRALVTPYGDLVTLLVLAPVGAVVYGAAVFAVDAVTGQHHRALAERLWRAYFADARRQVAGAPA